jgi:hypothetical protein
MCLEYAAPPDEEFRALDKMFAAADDGFGIGAVWQSERALWLTVLEDPKQLRDFLQWGPSNLGPMNDFEKFIKRRWGDVIASPLGRPIILKTQTAFLKLSEKVSKLNDRPLVDPKERDAAFEEFERVAAIQRVGLDVGDWGLRASNTFDQACERAHRRNVLARLALRLRRYYDQKGRLPGKLEELCDADMPRIRIDWFRNKPIVYAPSVEGFRLEVPEEILSKADRERKKTSKEANEMVLTVRWKTTTDAAKKPAK